MGNTGPALIDNLLLSLTQNALCTGAVHPASQPGDFCVRQGDAIYQGIIYVARKGTGLADPAADAAPTGRRAGELGVKPDTVDVNDARRTGTFDADRQ